MKPQVWNFNKFPGDSVAAGLEGIPWGSWLLEPWGAAGLHGPSEDQEAMLSTVRGVEREQAP